MYDLHKLGWQSFQQLCQTILRDILCQTVESYLDTHDGGRDGAFAGIWRASGDEDLTGPFVVQCKFTGKADYVLRPSDLSDEVEKARRLVAQGRCQSYLLMTNAGVTGTRAETISDLFKSVGVKHMGVFGSTWINQQIRESKRLRMLVPRVYGLGDLSQILDERAYLQARNILESMREDLAKVVVTDAYRRAAEALDEHGFVLLIGEPASGKTTIASLLAMAALDQWDSSILKLRKPHEVFDHWNPDEPSQFFWVDDAFGMLQYDYSSVQDWNHVLADLSAMLRTGAKIVMTSRDYIYNSARQELEGSAFPLLRESQVVIDVHELSLRERQQILYNHLKLGKQPRSFLTKIKPHLDNVAGHSRFIPETARRLADPSFTRSLFITDHHIGQFVEKREDLLQEVVGHLDIDSKAALGMVYMRDGHLQSPIELRPSETQAIERLGSDLGRCIRALEVLQDSFVTLSYASSESVWQYKHPTIGDAYAAILRQNPEHLGIFIQGTAPERLIDQVTCGHVGVANAVVVPASLFPLVLIKLDEISRRLTDESDWSAAYRAKHALYWFLSRRCSKEFLERYLQRNPGLVDEVSEPGLMLFGNPEVDLAKCLHEHGLLPEDRRKRVVRTTGEYAIDGMDASALSDNDIRSLFTDDEFEDLVQRIRAELLPRLDDVRYEWESNLPPDQSPQQYMEPLFDLFDSLRTQFGDDSAVNQAINHEASALAAWIDEHSEDDVETSPRQLGQIETTAEMLGTRSIFDDIDVDDDPESD